LKRKLGEFILSQNGNFSLELSSYFYENEIPYIQQRPTILKNNNNIIDYSTFANRYLYKLLKNKKFISYIITGEGVLGQLLIKSGKSGRKTKNKLLLTLVITCLLVTIIMSKIYDSNIYLFLLPLIPLWSILILKILIIDEDKQQLQMKIIFWLVLLCNIYSFWILLKPSIFFVDSDLLWDWFITIKRIYTIDEKIMYVYQVFEYKAQFLSNLPGNFNADYLRHMLRQIDLKILISDSTTLKDLSVYVSIFVENYILNEIYNNIVTEILMNEMFTKPSEKTFKVMRVIMILITLLTLGSMAHHYYNILQVYNKLKIPFELTILTSKIIQKSFPSTVRASKFTDFVIATFNKKTDLSIKTIIKPFIKAFDYFNDIFKTFGT
jgi:hypothetical protein